MDLHLPTPLLHGVVADGPSCQLKMECWQPVGSFKIRGIGRMVAHARAAGAAEIVSSSGGNAGMAAAWAARRLGLAATVIVPATTGEQVIGRLEALGATVQVAGAVWDEADLHARELAVAPERFYVSPFDHPEIWAGHQTLIAECVTQGPRPDGVVVSVGGGGLLCGVLQGLAACGWGEVPVHAVETAGAASLAAALSAGAAVTIDAIDSIATTLGARRVADRVLELARQHPVRSVIVSDGEAVAACLAFAESHRTLVEPACGAALAAVGLGRVPGKRLLVIVCGGAGVSLAQLERWRTTVPGVAEARIAPIRPEPAP